MRRSGIWREFTERKWGWQANRYAASAGGTARCGAAGRAREPVRDRAGRRRARPRTMRVRRRAPAVK
ncbi:hypothetical protein BURCENBC7_AP4586 [Burkholderia cenocepacia BC7]|nr:hypothetical protein BURCENBC7_AP4586 [Burkholderia cenocepacia BC7]